jgi:hypothetical protein
LLESNPTLLFTETKSNSTFIFLSEHHISVTALESKQKGTVVEKLTEETLRDKGHLLELLSVCEGVELNLPFLSLNH